MKYSEYPSFQSGVKTTPDFFLRVIKNKDDFLGLITSLFIYAVTSFIIAFEILFEYNHGINYIDVDMGIKIKNMPVLMYYLAMSILLSIVINFFRLLVSIFAEFLKVKLTGEKK